MTTQILVFVPGLLGSELWDGEDKIWPGSLLEAITGFDQTKFLRLMSPNLQARDIVRSAGGGLIGIYRDWIKAFEAIVRGGRNLFLENPPAGEPKTLYPFPYDWRVDLTVTVRAFASFLEDIVRTTSDADLVLVGHSLGGLLIRYYLESGTFNANPAFQKISLFTTFGTPHNGAPIAFAGVTGLHKTDFLSIAQSTALANDPRYPSLYQLFPSANQAFIWDANMPNAYKPYPPDDAGLVAKFKLNKSNLVAWQTLRSGLSGNKPAHIRYFYIVGSRQNTLARLLWDGASLQPVELDDAGDGTVSLPGAMDLTVQMEFVGNSHVDLIDTKPARQTLARLFGADTLFSAAELSRSETLSVRDRVVGTNDTIHVQIGFDPPVSRFKGTLSWQRANISQTGQTQSPSDFSPYGQPQRIELMGPSIDHLNLEVQPISHRGIYRPVLTNDVDPTLERLGPAFAVQQGP